MTEPKIPRFGSFKPAKPVLVSVKDEPTETRSKERTVKGNQSSERHDESRRRRHGRHRSRSREKSQTQPLHVEPPRAPDTYEMVDIFVVDRRGDEKNLTYGSIHKYSIPPFHRYGSGYVLGLSGDFKIDRTLGDDKELAIGRWRDSRTKTREKYVFSRVAKEKPRLLKLRPAISNADDVTVGEENFVLLTESRGKKRKRGGGSKVTHGDSSDSEKDERDYRSIYGKKVSKDAPSDDELQYATESDSSGSDAGYAIKTNPTALSRRIELSRRVEQNPNDIENWLALIDHQDVLLQSSADRRRITNAEAKSTAEIKIHMYEKALEKMVTLQDRERLLLGLMAEGVQIWDIKAQSDRWEQISNDNIDSLLLWTSYLNFKQSSFAKFRYEDIKELYLNRLKLLTRAIANANPTAIEPLFYQLIYISLRHTLFMRESGYSELGIAVWQATLELNFFGPAESLPRDKTLDNFKEFWESEVPRIGEIGALGWRKFTEDENSSEVPDTVIDKEGDSLDGNHIFESWAYAERLRSKNSLPARTMDEVIEDDPFRVILFSDIEEYIIVIPLQSERLRKLCLNAFLLFCRLPAIFNVSGQSQNWSLDPFVANDFLEDEIRWTEHDPSQEERDDSKEDKIQSMLSQQFTNFQETSDTTFGSSRWFKSKGWRVRFPAGNEPVPYQFARNALKQLNYYSSIEELAECHLAFEYINEPETIKKTAKAVLKRYPSSLRLYNAYAMIEWSRNRDIAIGVFSAALNMGSISETKRHNGCVVLWRSWIWSYIDDDDNASALGLLLSIADEKPNPTAALSPALLLRSKQHLASTRDFLLSSGSVDDAVMYGECLSLLEYLTATSNTEPRSSTQGDIAAAVQTYISFSTTLRIHPQSTQKAHEILLQSASRLILRHARSGPYRPSLVRLHLSSFITLFPQNTIFLSLFAWNERNLRVENRVRNILSTTILTSQHNNIASRIFAINYEISYGTIHSAKSAFEHALVSPNCKGSAGLWRFYILYILSVPAFKVKAKDVWYRALRACPWAKELYVLGFQRLGAAGIGMGFKEMKSAWRVMGEKELRVHVDLEDKFEEIGELEEKAALESKASARQRLGFK